MPILFPPSRGLYRLPYAPGTPVRVTRDVATHDPPGRLDLVAAADTSISSGRIPEGSGGLVAVVAAAGGHVRYIQDSYTGREEGPGCKNNYVWLQHPNGEWTKYSHLATGSVRSPSKAGLCEGQWVNAGTYLGDEHDVGCASGTHLHFEVAAGAESENGNRIVIDPTGGHLLNNHHSNRNRDPRFCGVRGKERGRWRGGRLKDGAEYTATWQPPNLSLEERSRREIVVCGMPLRFLTCYLGQLDEAGFEPTWLSVFNADVMLKGKRSALANVVARKRGNGVELGVGVGEEGVGTVSPQRPVVVLKGLSTQDYESKLQRMKARGFSPVVVNSYVKQGGGGDDGDEELCYAGLWKQSLNSNADTGADETYYEYHGVSAREHQRRFDSLTGTGWVPTCICVACVRGTRYWTGVYRQSKAMGVRSFAVRSTLRVTELDSFREENAQHGRHISYVSGYSHGDTTYLVAIATATNTTTRTETKDGRTECSMTRHAIDEAMLQAEQDAQSAKGRRCGALTGYQHNGDIKYVACWR